MSTCDPIRWCRRTGAEEFRLAGWLSVLVLALIPLVPAAQAVPEPSLVLYGVVRNTHPEGLDRLRMVFGRLTWTFQPTEGGAPITVSGTLTNVNDQFSYVLFVPCVTQLAGAPLPPDTLRLGASYQRGQVFFNDVAPATLADPAQANLSLFPRDRGRMERVDLEISVALEDSDGNGLPDDWERLFFGQTGVDPDADADRDGVSNWAEYKAGTDPTDPASRFAFVHVSVQPGEGFSIEWSSAANRTYSIERSENLLSGFAPIATQVPATPPVNAYLDATASDEVPYFYRLRLDH
ncbi:MAG TPA: hypothetical protein VMS21_05345 [Methylomirabilota bacterium]|nr:hypothetical protein [Methylomirabilota bacterium]